MSGTIGAQGARYLLIGGLNTVVSYGVFLVGVRAGWPHQGALALSFVVGAIHSYLWNRAWTFRATSDHRTLVPRFLAVTIAVYLTNAALLEGLVHLGLAAAIAQVLCLFITTALGFFGHRQWSFRADDHPVEG